MELSGLASAIMSGIMMGGIYALASIGLTLIWGVMNFINFASGQLTMLGMYITLALALFLGVDPIIGIAVSAGVLFIMGMLIEKTVISPILGASRFMQILVTLALGIAFENTIQLLFGAEIVALPRNIGSMKLLSQVIQLDGVSMIIARLIPLPVATILTIILHLFLTRTRVGMGIRAISQDPYAAQIVGINIKKAYLITWGIGCSFMGLAGALLVLFQAAYPAIGWEFIIVSFIAVTMGGAGSYIGSYVSAMIIGVIESISSYIFLPAYRQISYLVLFVLVLIFLPRGLFPTREVG